jgi:(p)ppGpp synthase/HD superfamily hydrolase
MVNSGKEWRFMDDKERISADFNMRFPLSKCLDFASKHHKGQLYGSKPYMYHLKKVGDVALGCNYTDISILISCVLHDIIEDTDVTYEDVKENFGEEVAEIVYCVTDELGRNRKERKSKTYNKIYDNPKAIVVKLCDRISNMYESMGTENYNLRLIKMYLDEHESFVDGIYNEDSLELTQKAWNGYNSVVLQLDYMFTDINDTLKHIENE